MRSRTLNTICGSFKIKEFKKKAIAGLQSLFLCSYPSQTVFIKVIDSVYKSLMAIINTLSSIKNGFSLGKF
jgi:hypothetical protein